MRVTVSDTFRQLAQRADLSQLVPHAHQRAEPRSGIRSSCNSSGSVLWVPFWPVACVISSPALSRYLGFQQEASISLAPIRALRLKEAQWARASPAPHLGDPDDRAESKLPEPVSLGIHWAPLTCLPAVLKDRPSCPAHIQA